MKKSLLILAVMACCCAAYAQDKTSAQEVLSLFATYNPSALQKAQEDPGYNALLQNIVNQAQIQDTLESRLEMIALVRNFDSSVKLFTTGREYEDAVLIAVTGDYPLEPVNAKYRPAFTEAYTNVWAVSVNIQEELLAQYQQMLKDSQKNTALSKEQRAEEKKSLKEKISNTQKYLKQMKKQPGEYIAGAVNEAMLDAQRNVGAKIAAINEVRAKKLAAARAQESANLEIKNKNQKPVAK